MAGNPIIPPKLSTPRHSTLYRHGIVVTGVSSRGRAKYHRRASTRKRNSSTERAKLEQVSGPASRSALKPKRKGR